MSKCKWKRGRFVRSGEKGGELAPNMSKAQQKKETLFLPVADGSKKGKNKK